MHNVTKRKILLVSDEGVADRELTMQLAACGYDTTITSLAEGAHLDGATGVALVLVDAASIGADVRKEIANVCHLRWAAPVLFVLHADEALSVAHDATTAAYSCMPRPRTDRELFLSIELEIARKERTTVVSEKENRFFSVSNDMLCFLNFSGHFAWLNAAWERTLGHTLDELMSKPFIEFVHPDDRERTLRQNAAVRAGGQARAFENRYMCKDGSYRWLHWNAAPHIGSQVIYSVARDITERKQAEAEREELLQALQKALAEVNSLREILPLCSYCRRVRDDENYWHTVEQYINTNTATRFSHSICPSCLESEVNPELDALERGQ